MVSVCGCLANGARAGSEAPATGESRREQLPPSAYRHRASRRLYTGIVSSPDEEPETIWDRVSGTIDSDGTFHGPPVARDYDDPDCGRVRYDDQRIVFSAARLDYSLTAQTSDCGRFEFEAELIRQ